MIDIRSIPVTEFTEASTVRLIPKAYIKEPAMAPLADNKNELDFLAELEKLTSGRQQETIPLPVDFSSEELLSEKHGYGWTYINAAFCYTRSTGNRFNDVGRGAWYAGWGGHSLQTAQSEVIYHLTRELEYTGVFENTTSYGELIAGFTAPMHDLRGFSKEPFLSESSSTAYPAGQHLARVLRMSGASGILYPSARHKSGDCLAAFRPNLVQNIRQGNSWTITWDGTSVPTITPYQ